MTLNEHIANVLTAQSKHDAAVEKRATAQREELAARERLIDALRGFDQCFAALKMELRASTEGNPIQGLPEK